LSLFELINLNRKDFGVV